jgi:hypothetical protein
MICTRELSACSVRLSKEVCAGVAGVAGVECA